MSSTLTYGSWPCVTSHKHTKASVRAQVIISAPKVREQASLPQLSLPEIPIREIVCRQSQRNSMLDTNRPRFHPMFLEEAYERCRNICAEYAKTFYLGTCYKVSLFCLGLLQCMFWAQSDMMFIWLLFRYTVDDRGATESDMGYLW